MSPLTHNTIFYQYRVLESLEMSLLQEEYRVEHLFLGSLERIRLISPVITTIPECTSIIEQNIKDLSKLCHPFVASILLMDKVDDFLFYSIQDFSGENCREIFLKEKLQDIHHFFDFHSKLIELVTYLHKENISTENLQLGDIVITEGTPFLSHLDIFMGIEQKLTDPEHSQVLDALKIRRGISFQKPTYSTKEDLRNLAGLMYETIGWGKVEDAIKIKLREETPTKKKTTPKHVPLVPGIDPRIENIILRAYADKEDSGYIALEELQRDLIKITEEEISEEPEPPSIAVKFRFRELETQELPRVTTGNIPDVEEDIIRKGNEFEFLDSPLEESVPLPREGFIERLGLKTYLPNRVLLISIITLCLFFIVAYAALNYKTLIMGKRNVAPVARATAPSNFIKAGTSLRLDASSSSDPETEKLSYYWDVVKGDPEAVIFSANQTTDAFNPTVYFRNAGDYTIRLKVFDGTSFSEPTFLVFTVY